MADFQKHQIRRQALNNQLPLKLINYLDFEEHIIKQGFTTKSRFIMPKSQQKIFPIDDEFRNAFLLFSLDEKVNFYSKQIVFLSNFFENGGINFQTQTNITESVSIVCKVKGKTLGGQWQRVTITLYTSKCVVEIPHKSGLYKTDLHDYLVRESVDQDRNQIVLEAIKPNIIKHWRLSFENDDQYFNAFRLISTTADRALKKILTDDLRNFQQSLVINSKVNFKKKSQIDFPKPSFLDASKFSSQVFETNNNSIFPQKNNKKTVNFQNGNTSPLSKTNGRLDTSIIDILTNTVRIASPPLNYQSVQPPSLFDTDQDWFIKIMAEGYICPTLFGGKQPEAVFNTQSDYRIIYENGSNTILHHKQDSQTFRLSTKLRFPRDLVLAALCEFDKWELWNKAVEEAVIKLRVPNSNLLVCKMKMKPLNSQYRSREFLFMVNMFTQQNNYYLVITSIKNSYYPTEDDSIRAKISKALVRIKQGTSGGTLLDIALDMKHLGELNFNQQAELTQQFLFGFFNLEPCLKDRVFVEAKASKYFDLKWSSEKFSRFTLGKNNELDETNSFTSNLCEEIASFYSANGPEDWSGIDDAFLPPKVIQFQQKKVSFKKKKNYEESNVGTSPALNQKKLPFSVPVQNNKVILDDDMKKQIERYIRQKEEERLRNTTQLIESRRSLIGKNPSKLPLPAPLRSNQYEFSDRSQKASQKRTSFVEMKQVKSYEIIKPPENLPIYNKVVTPSIRKASIDSNKSNTILSNHLNQANIRSSQASNFDPLPRKMISKIEIEKYNPDDHIVPFWEPLVYPDTGQIILSSEYLQKWVSPIPIAVKKKRMYKGETWNHFFLRDLWAVLPNGDVKCVNQAKLDMQSSAIKLVLKRFASNVMSGKGILNVSLPVEIFSELSCLQLIARSLCFAPYFLQRAAINPDPIERFKIVNGFSLATSLLYIEMEKPFNPILGQTYQGWIAGCPIFCEQISHHPPISAFYFVGRGYTISGRLEPTIDLSLNSGVGWNEGEFTIAFTNYPNCPIKTQSPPGEITGLAYGDRKLNFTGKSYSYDANGLFCQLTFNPTKKGMLSFGKQQKQSDYMKGALVRVDKSFIHKYRAANSKKREAPSKNEILQKICDAEGRWTVGLNFGGVEYFNVMRDQPVMLEQEKYPLNSHCNYREDIYYRRAMNYELSQSHKQRLEILQRNDKKLREAYHPQRKH